MISAPGQRRFTSNNTFTLKCLLVVGFVITGLASAAATERRVPSEYATIQSAVDAAETGDVVLIADGVYTGEGNALVDLLGKAITVRSENGPEACIIDAEQQPGGFQLVSGETRATVIEGLTIRNVETNAAMTQAAIYLRNSSATIDNCTIADCAREPDGFASTSGSATVWGKNSNAVIRDCRFLNNYSYTGGGAIYFDTCVSPQISECYFYRNQALSGGAIRLYHTQADIDDCEFEGNRSLGIRRYWGISSNTQASGGAIYSTYADTLSVQRCRFMGNLGTNGGAIRIFAAKNVHFTKNLFINNVAFSSGSPIEHLEFQNELNGRGGAIDISTYAQSPLANITIDGCVFVSNRAEYHGSALYLDRTYGGELSVEIENSTIANNQIRSGTDSAIALDPNNSTTQLAVHNSILWGNGVADSEAEQISPLDSNGLVDVTYSCIQGLDLLANASNICANPMLIADGYHLVADSPCISAGDIEESPSTDIDDETRAADAIDIGADQYVDSDNDQLGDWWEFKYAGNLSIEPNDNLDGDTLTADAEYLAERNPLLPPRELLVRLETSPPTPGLYPNIQAALDASHPREGDVVMLMPGNYAGKGNIDLDPHGKHLTLQGAAGALPSMIMCEPDIDGILVGPGASFIIKNVGFSGFESTTGSRNPIVGDLGQGAGISIYGNSLKLLDCTFINDYRSGYAIRAMRSSDLKIERCKFSELGFAIFTDYLAHAKINSCVFDDLKRSDTLGKYANVLCTWCACDVDFLNCTFNTDENVVFFGTQVQDSDIRFSNCAFAPAAVSFYASIAYSMMSDYENRAIDPNLIGPGMIDAVPQFVDPNNGDLRLMPGSPGIDAGDPNSTIGAQPLDFAGHYRIVDGDGDGVARIDMGAYEFNSAEPGDLNCDGGVNAFDIDPFILALLEPVVYEANYPGCHAILADMQFDDTVDAFDIDPFVGCVINGGCIE